jgi:hypothetical protein
MTEALHRDVQPLRGNVFDTAKYLREQNVFFAFNHLFMLFNDQMPVESYVRQALAMAPGLETRNGAMLQEHNEFIEALAGSLRTAGVAPVAIGGSDAHILRYVGTTYTEAPGQTREEYLANLVEGRTRVGGAHGSRRRLFTEIYGTVANHWGGLFGLKRLEVTMPERAFSLVCSALLLPVQFVPGAIALRMKHREHERVDRYRRIWAADVQAAPLVTGTRQM